MPLWPLPLAAGLLPAIAALVALACYTQDAGVFCNPFVQDCVSISRMARHGLANPIFRALVLPAGVLQALTWFAAARAFAGAGLPRRNAWLLAGLGVLAGVALIVYGSFLGTDGAVYRWLRRWGTLAYYAGTYLAMLLATRAAGRLHRAGRLDLPAGAHRLLLALLAFITVLCLGHGFISLLGQKAWESRIENLVEWWGSVALTGVFLTLAWLWRHWGLQAGVGLRQ